MTKWGLSQAFILGAEFIDNDDVCRVLGYHVKDPDQYGVVDFDSAGNALSGGGPWFCLVRYRHPPITIEYCPPINRY